MTRTIESITLRIAALEKRNDPTNKPIIAKLRRELRRMGN